MRISHLKILGCLWVLFGFWCAWISFAPLRISYSAQAWREEVIGYTLGCLFFLAPLLVGVGLLRRWRWAQGGLAILGVVVLALWVLFIVSPKFPPTTLAEDILHSSPLLGLALYSLAAVLLPGSEANLSRRSRILTAFGSVFGVFAAIGFHLWAFHDAPPNPTAEAQSLWEEAHEKR